MARMRVPVMPDLPLASVCRYGRRPVGRTVFARSTRVHAAARVLDVRASLCYPPQCRRRHRGDRIMDAHQARPKERIMARDGITHHARREFLRIAGSGLAVLTIAARPGI